MTDSNSDGTIVNPGAVYDPQLDYDQVGDVADEANDLRFNEEEVLIREQSHSEEDPA
ncbi:hypothetical protein [Psychromicrobium sp. YIM B11713]|uniref:hypothetical protein n=1 Tax=Psychromicrobium sp. YIM B11713 TaxID=3145233 RepID=UPI00374EB09E